MTSRPVVALYGALWAVCGFLIRVGPAPADTRAAIAVQATGWLIAVTGVFALLTAVSRSRFSIDLRPPRRRHASWWIGAVAIVVVAGGWALWWGIGDGTRSAICVGLVILSTAPILLMRATAPPREHPVADG